MGHSYIFFLLCVMIYTRSMKAVANKHHEDSFCKRDGDCEGGFNQESQVNMEAPIQFIEFAKDGKMSVSSEALVVLNSITKPITVVAIAGKYRIGKSYIMNRIFGKRKGFTVGGTILAETKGIWMWIRIHPADPSRYLILLDTEGIGDTEKDNRERENTIFSLALLLSNCFIFKSSGTIDNQAIEQLHFISELTKHIKIKSSEDKESGEYLEGYFPTFVWILRDFKFKKTIDGKKEITSDQYLEHALKLKKGTSKEVNDANRKRDSLKRFFRERHCFTFPSPCSDEYLEDLENVSDEKMNKEYLNSLNQMKDFLYQSVGASMVDNEQINGMVLAGLAEKYVEAIVNGGVPCIETAVEMVAKIHCEKAKHAGLKRYKEEMNKNAVAKFPTTFETLQSAHKGAFLAASKIYQELEAFDKDHIYRKAFQEQLDNEFKQLQQDNRKASAKKCKTLLKNLYDQVKIKIKNGAYSLSGGYTKYKNDKEIVIATYKNFENKGSEDNSVLTEFCEETLAEEMQILNSDNEISRNEKINMEQNAKLQVAIEKQNSYKLQIEMLEKYQSILEDNHRYQRGQAKIKHPKCFAGTSVVRVKGSDGAIHTKQILDLNVGDMVESFDPENHRVVFSEVYFITHDDNSTGSVINIHVDCHKGFTKAISLDNNHLIYVTTFGESIINSTSVITPVEAQSVRIGDYLWVRQDANSLLPCQVVAIKGRDHVVVRHPMTMNHYIIVDDILASVHMFYEQTYRMITSPLRMIYRINPSWCKSRFLKWVVGLWDGVEEWFPSFTHTMAIQSMNLPDFWGSTANIE